VDGRKPAGRLRSNGTKGDVVGFGPWHPRFGGDAGTDRKVGVRREPQGGFGFLGVFSRSGFHAPRRGVSLQAMAWPEDALSDDEVIITSFRPHWKLLFVPLLWFVGLSVAMILVAVYLDLLQWILIAALVVFLVIFVVKPLVGWWTTRYVLTSERLITRSGLIAKTGVEIPLERITNVNFSQTFFERLLGAGDLLIESAGAQGQSKFRDIPHPDAFQTVLYKAREARSLEMTGTQRQPQRTDHAGAIRDLARLRDEGLISEEEYEAKRRKLLEEM
jgi:membrane protein YdbS with pleckstrin-like domain